MGLFFRKSEKIGPFRINFSKSGIGVSTGFKGARLSIGPSGTYVHLGKNGIYYRRKLDKRNRKHSSTVINDKSSQEHDVRTFQTGDVSQVTDIDSQDFINELDQVSRAKG